MPPRPHQLAHIRPSVLQQAAAAAQDERVRDGLNHWAAAQLPLVVTRQVPALPTGSLRMGLPLPTQWGRLRIPLVVDVADVLSFADFPSLNDLREGPRAHQYASLSNLCAALQSHDLRAQVYGSHGWQHISGMDYTHAQSDLDLLIVVNSLAAADTAAECLHAVDQRAPQCARIDGELMFTDGTAVAWREWQPWRTGRTRQILIKQADGAALADSLTWPTTA